MASETILLAVEARDAASAIFSKLEGVLTHLGGKYKETKKASEEASTTATSKVSPAMLGIGMAGAAAAVGVGLLVKGSVDAATSYQSALTQLVTGAGESEKNIDMVGNGLLQMSAQVGVGADQLAQGMFLVESAGFHGAAGLKVMQAAAEGAKVGGADMGVMADAVTSALNAYGMGADQAGKMTSMMVETVASGKMHMQDLAGALSAVLPTASAAGISFQEVGGAIATMTGEGVSAQQASQDLANVIRSLQKPTAEAVKEMEQMGLNSTDVAANLGKRGLSGTIEMLADTVASKMGPSGLVMADTFKKSQSAAEDAKRELDAMPASMKQMAQGFLDGTVSASTWSKEIKSLPESQRELARQFAATSKDARGFSDLLKSGSPEAQTYAAAMSQMLGGATGLNVALELTGTHTDTLNSNIKAIGATTTEAGGHVQGWATKQKDLDQQEAELNATLGETSIAIGEGIIPAISQVASAILPTVTSVTGWMTQNKNLVAGVLVVVGALGALVAIVSIVSAVVTAVSAVTKVWTALQEVAKIATLAWQGAQWLLNIALDANPIGIAVIVIAALVAGVILAYQHVGWFRDAVNDAWGALQGFGGWMHDTLLPTLQSIGNFIATVAGQLQGLVNAAKNVPVLGGIGGALGIPGFQEGGTVPGPIGMPSLAVVHGGEQITPPGGDSGSGGPSINVYVYGSDAADPYAIAREMAWAMKHN